MRSGEVQNITCTEIRTGTKETVKDNEKRRKERSVWKYETLTDITKFIWTEHLYAPAMQTSCVRLWRKWGSKEG